MIDSNKQYLTYKMYDLPFHGAIKFDKKEPGKIAVVHNNKKLEVEINLIGEISQDFMFSMLEKDGFVICNIADANNAIFKISMNTNSFVQITHFLLKDYLAVNINSKTPDASQEPLTEEQALLNWGLTREQYETLLKYSDDHQLEFQSSMEPKFIRRNDPVLPRSIVYDPFDAINTTYALLKTHGGVKEVGLGAFNLVTYALPLNSNLPFNSCPMKVFRSCKKSQNGATESDFNNRLANNKSCFLVGTEFNYPGPIRSRAGANGQERNLNCSKEYIPKEENVEKVGLLLDYFAEGTLFDLFYEKKFGDDFLQSILFAMKYTSALHLLHDKYKIVHLDQKPQNVFISNEWNPKIGDFGLSAMVGEMKLPCGDLIYIAPEIVNGKEDLIRIESSMDIWGLGLILLLLIEGLVDWQDAYFKSKDFDHIFPNLNKTKHEIFQCLRMENKGKEGFNEFKEGFNEFIDIIDKCLQLDPSMRLTALEVYNRLGVICHHLTQTL